MFANTFEDQPVFYHNLGDDGNGNWLGLADESAARFPLPLNVPLLQFCALWAGDIDNNGSLDIYFSNYGQNSGQGGVLDVLLINDGNGYFTDESQSRLGNLRNSAFGTSVEIHDMDGDDDLDIVKISTLYNVEPWNNRGVFILFNDGSGNFSNWQNIAAQNAPYMFTIDDFDDNGLNDLYVVDDNSDYVLTANFAIPDISVNYSSQTSPDPRTVFFGGNCKLGDIDKDGDMDFGIAGVDVDIPPCQITGIRQFTMDRNDNGSISAPYGPVNYPWNVSVYDFAFINLNDDCFPDLFLGLCDEFIVFINQSENDPIQISGDTIICQGVSTTLSAPSGYVDYSWSNGNNSQSISVNEEGDYCVTVTKENGCTISDCVSVEEQSELYVEISGNDFLCFNDFETMLIADPGFSTYEWSTFETTQIIYVASSGIYCVTVSDNNGCQGDTCVEIIQYPELSVNIIGETEVCLGETSILTASNGFQNYFWSNNEQTSAIEVLPGTYCVTVTDNNGCTASSCQTVTELPKVVFNISGNTSFCDGETTSIAVDSDFSTYLWSNNETTQEINVSTSGEYCVTATDDDGCTAAGCVTINENPEVSVSISGENLICFNETATISVDSVFSTYLWSNDETTQSINTSSPGDFCVTVTDDLGCEGEACFTITENPELIVTISGESIFCPGESIELTATGGFTNYNWSTSESGSNIVVNNGGIYCVTVTDDNGCTAEDCKEVIENPEVNLNITGESFICDGDSVSLVATNGFQNYEWSNGQSGSTVVVNMDGDYCVTVTDTNGCTGEDCLFVEAVPLSTTSIAETICHGDTLEIGGELFFEEGQYQVVLPNANVLGCDSTINLDLSINPEIVIANSIITKDDGSGNGSIEIEIEGGTPPFLAQWDNGDFGIILPSLPFGDYTLTITDSKGCTATFVFTVELETSTHNQLEKDLNLKIKPNPFSENTRLNYELHMSSNVRIDVVNLHGQLIENLFTGNQLPDSYEFVWEPKNQVSGVYYFKIGINGKVIVKKVVLMK